MKTFVSQTKASSGHEGLSSVKDRRTGGVAAPAAGGDAIFSTHTIPEEQAQRYCWIIRNRDRNDPRSDDTL